jgi:hypothetical protein
MLRCCTTPRTGAAFALVLLLAAVAAAAPPTAPRFQEPALGIPPELRALLERVPPTPAAPPRSWSTASNAAVAALVQEVSRDSVTGRVVDLEAFLTRKADLAEARRVALWLADRFRAFGADSVFVHDFSRSYAPSVIAFRRGTVRPDEVHIVGGHFDSISYSSWGAPGADDNASGTSAVLECARVLCRTRFESTLCFAAWSAEEFGLLGSNAYATLLYRRGEAPASVVNIDMIGYRDPSDFRDLDIISGGGGWLRDLVFEVARQHVPDLPLVDGQYPGSANSDQASFWARGWPAISFFEDSHSSSPYLHTPNDLFGQSYNDEVLATQSTRVAVALLATLAVPVVVPVAVADFEARAADGAVALAWSLEGDLHDTAGVRVQRAASPHGPFADRTPVPLTPESRMWFVDLPEGGEDGLWYRLVLVGFGGEAVAAGPLAVHVQGHDRARLEVAHGADGVVRLRYAVGPRDAEVSLRIMDVRGRLVRGLEAGRRAPGAYERSWDRRDEHGAEVSRGIYFVQLTAGSEELVRRLPLTRN